MPERPMSELVHTARNDAPALLFCAFAVVCTFLI